MIAPAWEAHTTDSKGVRSTPPASGWGTRQADRTTDTPKANQAERAPPSKKEKKKKSNKKIKKT